ncbi:hypothetical protein BXJ07_08960 [Salmonella enterica subsp. enterica serovar Typhimurium]|nr:hypothetical protein [Salmonella enterica subsp. enterica serovar Typhimurium]
MWLFVTHRGDQCNNSICAVAVMENDKKSPLKIMAQSGGDLYGKENTTRTPFLQPYISFFLHYLCLR